MKYWLLKSEPDAFSLDDLKAMKGQREHWDGIRNYQARNFMRDEMKAGDLGLFYHSSCPEPGVAGVVRVVKEAYPDHTAWDKKSKYYDPKSTKENPRWIMVDIKFECDLPKFLPLGELREDDNLDGMLLLRKGNRLSITPVEKAHFHRVCKLGGLKTVPK